MLWRTFLLIAGLMLLSLAAWFFIITGFERSPRTAQAAQMLVSVVNITRTALLTADPAHRYNLLRDLSNLEGIRIYPAEQDDHLLLAPDVAPLSDLRQEIHRRLGDYTRIALQRNGELGLFISFRLYEDEPDDEYWVMIPRERVARLGAAEWAGWGAAAMGLSLLGAYLIVRSLSRPLAALARAARSIGRGELPKPLPEAGSIEIKAVAQAFNQMSTDLAQLESDRALILAGISHDLRTPLARLRLGIELSGAMVEDQVAMAADIDDMDRIIDQFLDFARPTANDAPMVVNLAAWVEEVGEPWRNRGLQHIETIESLEVAVRPVSLRRAISNLLENAVKYGRPPIELAIDRWRDGFELRIRDHGPGIPTDHIERLKRPFTRMNDARSNVTGSGLGLAIVERIARQGGGSLELLPADGGGLLARLRMRGEDVETRD